jgi:hypothetical protein
VSGENGYGAKSILPQIGVSPLSSGVSRAFTTGGQGRGFLRRGDVQRHIDEEGTEEAQEEAVT